MSKGGGGGKMPVTEYFISAHYGVCLDEVDEVTRFYYGEKELWAGSITANSTLQISKGNLFGGEKVEGGFKGIIDVLLGGAGQRSPGSLVSSLRRNGANGVSDANDVPGYRGMLSFFVHNGNRGASICHNTAAVKPFWVTIRRAPKGCPFDPVIWVEGMRLANPAAIIYECLTNGDWAMAGAAANVDAGSFAAAAATLKNEGFGLALLWHKQESIEDFVGRILNHIDGSLSLDPFTGKFRLKLIRDDYDPDAVPVFGPDNATLKSFSRKSWGETLNEINVTWTNPANEKEENVTVHDTANIALQGGVLISETRDFTGIRNSALALRVATRELLAASSALATGELVVNRRAWRVLPGDVVALSWPDYDYDRIFMRVTNVDYGAPGDSAITLTLIEDVFALPESSLVDSEGSAWVNPAVDPVPLEHSHIASAPYFALVQRVGEDTAEAVPDTSDTDIVFGTHPLVGVYSYDVMQQVADPNGDLSWASRRTVSPAGRGVTANALSRETLSTLTGLDRVSHGEHFVTGALVWIGPIDQTGELAVIRSLTGDSYTLGRGVLDTVPKEWPAGTSVWALHGGVFGSTGTERSVGETASVRLLTNTANGQLDIAEAVDVTGEMTGRLHRPYRPANLRAFGSLWPEAETYPEYPVSVTWAGRNRLFETTVVNAWDDGSVTPEDGTDYRVLVEAIQENGTVDGVVEDTMTTGTSYILDGASIPPGLAGSPFMRVTVWAVREGLQSWQAATIRFRGPFREPTQLSAIYATPKPPQNVTYIVV